MLSMAILASCAQRLPLTKPSISTQATAEKIVNISQIDFTFSNPATLEAVMRGYDYYQNGDYDNAVIEYTNALHIEPSNAAIRFYRGNAYLENKDYNDAIVDYSSALYQYPYDTNTLISRSRAYLLKGEFDNAIKDADVSLSMSPANEFTLYSRGLAYSGKEYYDLAIKDFTDAININPNNTIYLNERGNAYNRKGEYQKAIDDYSAVLLVDPNNTAVLVSRGNAYNRKGEYDTAINDYNTALVMEPNNENIKIDLAQAETARTASLQTPTTTINLPTIPIPVQLQPIIQIMSSDPAILYSTNITGSITTAKNMERHKIDLPLPGSISINITNDGTSRALPDQGADVQWLNAEGVKINGSNGGFKFPYSQSMDLAAGTYYIDVIGRTGIGNTGTYSIRADYYNNEKEPNNTRETAHLLLSGLTVKGSISDQDKIDLYQYNLNKPGRLEINITSNAVNGLGWSYVRLLNFDGTQIRRDNPSLSNPYNFYIDLEAGSYYIEITQDGNSKGTYNLLGKIITAENNQKEPNNTLTTAQILAINESVTGFFSYQEKMDIYKYELTQPGKFSVNITSGKTMGLGWSYVRWLNTDGTQIKRDNPSLSNPYNNSMYLEAGIYYIEITPDGSSTGIYNLTGSFLPLGNNEIEPNGTRATAQLLEAGQIITGFISYQDKLDMYRFDLIKSGRLTINITSDKNNGLSWLYVRWLNIDGDQIKKDNPSLSSPYNGYMDLEAGTYFIEITPDGDTQGIYNISIR